MILDFEKMQVVVSIFPILASPPPPFNPYTLALVESVDEDKFF